MLCCQGRCSEEHVSDCALNFQVGFIDDVAIEFCFHEIFDGAKGACTLNGRREVHWH